MNINSLKDLDAKVRYEAVDALYVHEVDAVPEDIARALLLDRDEDVAYLAYKKFYKAKYLVELMENGHRRKDYSLHEDFTIMPNDWSRVDPTVAVAFLGAIVTELQEEMKDLRYALEAALNEGHS